MHPAARVSYYPPQPPPLLPRGASLGFRSFSALGSGAEVGSWGKKAAGRGEAMAEGKELGQVWQVPPTSLGWGTYQTSTPTWCLAPRARGRGFLQGVLKAFPALAGACKNLRKLGISKVQTLPQSWPLPCWPSPGPVYLPTWPPSRFCRG